MQEGVQEVQEGALRRVCASEEVHGNWMPMQASEWNEARKMWLADERTSRDVERPVQPRNLERNREAHAHPSMRPTSRRRHWSRHVRGRRPQPRKGPAPEGRLTPPPEVF